ncbi:40S ribosomal protein S27 [Merluccius polli]|uniref:40S ribosomal protein S27 n=1 Tax=Merluccius polli TaxID=89951 RepID=A0AA47MT00_MERPO|nr:40S ribosomal protein S27 [Merluccius polli]
MKPWLPLAKDLLHPTPEEEKRRHKKKRLVQSPNSYFMDVKCPGNYKSTSGESYVNPLEAKHVSQRDAHSGGSSTRCFPWRGMGEVALERLMSACSAPTWQAVLYFKTKPIDRQDQID